jgi:sulfonate transport system substrate-binding protein
MNGLQRNSLSEYGCAATVLVISFLLPVLAGCRKSSEKAAGPSEPVTIAYAAVPHAALVQIAFAKGYFKEEGLNIRIQAYGFGKPALEAMLRGKADLATSAEIPVMFAIMNGGRICIPAIIETSNTDNAVIARKDLGISSPSDIRGKLIAVPMGTTAEFFLFSFLTAHGMDRTDVGIINMTPGEIKKGLAEKRIAVAAMWNPPLAVSKRELGDKGVVFYEKEIYTEFFCLAADRMFAEKQPDDITKVVKALVRAEEFARTRPEEAFDLVADFTKINKPVLRLIWNDFRFKVALNQSLIVALEDETRWAIQKRLVKNRVMPNYLDFICSDALSAVRPDSVRIIK